MSVHQANRKWEVQRRSALCSSSILFGCLCETSVEVKGRSRGSQRDVVYLGWPIAFSYTVWAQKRGWGWGIGVEGSQPIRCAHGAQINFEDLNPYLTYGRAGPSLPVEMWVMPVAVGLVSLHTHTNHPRHQYGRGDSPWGLLTLKHAFFNLYNQPIV